MAKIRLNPGLPEQESEEKRLSRLKKWRAAALLSLFLAAAGLVLLMFFFMRKAFFNSNPHFKLKKMEIINGSFWQGKEKLLAARTGIAPGNNLFDINYTQLRKKIELIPGIESAEAIRILPDKLQIRITERIPRAVLFNPGGRYVVDEKGVIIPRNEAAVHGNLPVITSIPGHTRFRQGDAIETLRPSIELIMMTLRNFPDINIECVIPRDEEKLEFFMRYRPGITPGGGKRYRVLIPLRNQGLPYLLSALQTAIIHAHWKQLNVSGFNLLFDGRVVLN